MSFSSTTAGNQKAASLARGGHNSVLAKYVTTSGQQTLGVSGGGTLENKHKSNKKTSFTKCGSVSSSYSTYTKS